MIHGVRTALVILSTISLYVADRVYMVFAPNQLPTEIYMLLLGTMFKDNKIVMTISKFFIDSNFSKRKGNNKK